MLTNAVESTPVLHGLKTDLHNENKWIQLISCQTTRDAQLEVLWRAAATLPQSLHIWTSLLQLTVAQNDTQTTLKVLNEAIARFPNNTDFWKLAMSLSPSIETFSTALNRIDPVLVWPDFLAFLVHPESNEPQIRYFWFENAIEAGVCALDELLGQISTEPIIYAQLLLKHKPKSWELWSPVLNCTSSYMTSDDLPFRPQTLLETALCVFSASHEAEIVEKLVYQMRANFRETRTVLVHFMERARTVEAYCKAFRITVNLYEAEIDKNATDFTVHDRWNNNQILLTELRNIVRKRAQQISDIAVRQDPNNVQLWLDRASLHQKRPHVAAHIMEQAIETISVYEAHNGDLADIYVRYANLLLDNGSDQAKACEPINKCLAMKLLSDRQRAKLYTAMLHIQHSRDAAMALKTLESALRDHKLEPIRPHLWSNYFELVSDSDQVLAAFSRCCIQREVTPRVVIQVAEILSDNTLNQRAVFEKGVSLFPTSVSLPIWKSFLKSLELPNKEARDSENKQRLADARVVFERAILAFSSNIHASEELVQIYGNLELDNPRGSVLNVRRAVHRIIDSTKNKAVWKLYVSSFVDIDGKRSAYERAIRKLDDVDASALALEMAEFEEQLQELQRCQELYRYAASLHRSAEILNAWQQFERRNDIAMVEFVPQH